MTLPILQSCTDCGACCLTVHSPPFVVLTDAETGELVPFPDRLAQSEYDRDADTAVEEDYRLLAAAPAEARTIRFAGLFDDRPHDSPCSWFDPVTRRCRWYEFRPLICREFVVGGASCLRHRRRAGLEADFVPVPEDD